MHINHWNNLYQTLYRAREKLKEYSWLEKPCNPQSHTLGAQKLQILDQSFVEKACVSKYVNMSALYISTK